MPLTLITGSGTWWIVHFLQAEAYISCQLPRNNAVRRIDQYIVGKVDKQN